MCVGSESIIYVDKKNFLRFITQDEFYFTFYRPRNQCDSEHGSIFTHETVRCVCVTCVMLPPAVAVLEDVLKMHQDVRVVLKHHNHPLGSRTPPRIPVPFCSSFLATTDLSLIFSLFLCLSVSLSCLRDDWAEKEKVDGKENYICFFNVFFYKVDVF